MTETFPEYLPAALPDVVTAYLDARDAQRHTDATAVFATDATVRDDGNTYEGIDAISTWIAHSSTEYTYTSTRVGQRIIDDTHTTVQVRLDGDFPGSTVTLRYQFEHVDGLITRLAIEV
ncbi:nuclear transport factor 2 family protein [Nocardia sp. NPDC058176]|uniref:nuclear transport factor 2 family protein n=1 Tax=Nocardia sp. NPDC058176 TaxID=3346368 RepID=UPI0036D89611